MKRILAKVKILKLILPFVISAALVVVIFFLITQDAPKTVLPLPEMDIFVKNESTKWLSCCDQDESDYKLDFIKINTLAFKNENGDLFIKYQLNGKLPKNIYSLPKYKNDKITGAVFYMSLDDNYFDNNGQKNPGGPEARLKASFYGEDIDDKDDSKITVDGSLVAGGPGYDYFVEKYPISKILVNSNTSQLVVTASSLATSNNHPAGASRFMVENSSLAATKENPREILININQKTVLPDLD